MAGDIGDCATVLEQFIYESANLPAEINFMMEEIQAHDREAHRFKMNIDSKESALQKQVKNHGSLVAHPKEQEFVAYLRKGYDACLGIQDKKIAFAEKALSGLDRQLRHMDAKIEGLVQSGIEDLEGLPSVHNRKVDNPKVQFDMPPSNLPLQVANISALNASAHRLNAQIAPTIRQPQPRQIQQVTASITQPTRSPAPATPASAALQVQKQSQEREGSAGADSKRRKLNMITTGINLPAQPSSLRQSSIGPGTPKVGTPTGSRAGSTPRTLATGIHVPKKGPISLSKHAPTHKQLAKLKKKGHTRLSQVGGRKKAGSPAVRGGRAGTEASEDSMLSSADASDTDTSQAKRRRKKAAQHQPDPPSASEEEGEDDPDDKIYCYCSQKSSGDMVGCENPDCPREWFHIECLGLKTVPQEEHWFCPECRTEEAGGNKKKK